MSQVRVRWWFVFGVAVCWAATGVGAEEVLPAGSADGLRLVDESEAGTLAAGIIGIEIDADAYGRLWDEGRAVVEEFPLPGRLPVALELSAFTIVAPGARFVAVGGDGERDTPAPAIRFFRGTVQGDVRSRVMLSLFEGRIAGFVQAWGEEFGVGPVDYDLARPGGKDLRVWNRRQVETEHRSCDGALEARRIEPVDDSGSSGPAFAGGVGSGTQLKAQVAVDATVEWFNHFGSLTAAQNYILNLMAEVSTIYDTELLIQIEVPYVRVFTAEPDPYTDGSTDTSVLLDELQAEWNANQTGVFRTAAHLLSVRPSGGSGLAYIDVLCDNVVDPGDSADYGVSTLSANGGSFEKELVAHEIGHNFSSPHTHCYVPEIDQCAIQTGCFQGPVVQTVGTIMSYCDDDIPEFHPRVEDEKIRPAAEAAFPLCIDTAGLPADVREQTGDGLRLSAPAQCPPATLQNDDGTLNTYYGGTGTTQIAWINRFTPSCYPFQVTEARVLIGHSSVAVGRPIRVLVYTDPSGSGDPANATLAYTEDVTVQVVSTGTLNAYTLASPVTVTSGDFYLGFYDLVADPDTNFIVSADTSVTGDSFRAFNSTSPGDFGADTSRTYMIRGLGGAVPAGSVLLEWGLPCNDATVPGQDFGIYRGDIGNFAQVTSLTCSTARAQDYLAEAPPADSFFLVVPQTTVAEGSYGQTGDGTERPTAATACKPQNPGTCP